MKEQQTKIEELQSITLELRQFIERGLQESQSMRRGGFLRYIAGQNPNIVITACLSGAEASLTTLLKKMPESSEILHPLAQLMAERTKGRWKWSSLSKELKEELNQVNDLVKQLEDRRIILKQQQLGLSQEIDKFLLGN